MQLFRVVLSYAVFAIVVDDSGNVVEAAPIGSWMLGKSIDNVSNWIIKKRGTLERLERNAS